MLRGFAFQEWVIDLFFRTLSNNWFSILIGGWLDLFKSSRGVRHRGPLSPILFLLVVEYMGRGIYHALLSNEKRYFASTRDRVPYLAFADDTIIFTRCSEDCLLAIK